MMVLHWTRDMHSSHSHWPSIRDLFEMGLGEAYLVVFVGIAKSALLVSLVSVGLIRALKRIHTGKLFLVGCVLWIGLTFAGLNWFHRDRFVDLHQSHNDYVPRSGCLTYEPTFGHLFASYAMSRDDFDTWLAAYLVPLMPYEDFLQRFDEERMGFTEPDAAYATEPASNGAQTRVYFKDGVMYFSRNVM